MVKVFVRRVVAFGIIGLIVGLVVSLFWPPLYEGRALLLVGDPYRGPIADPTLSPDAARTVERWSTGNAPTELDLLRSPDVFYRALELANVENRDRDFQGMYRMYSVVSQVADNPNQQSNVANVQVRMRTADMAQKVAEKIAEACNEKRQSAEQEGIDLATNRVREQLSQAQKDLAVKTAAYEQYKQANQVTDLPLDTQQGLALMRDLEGRRNQVTSDLAGAETEVRRQKTALARLPKQVSVSATEVRNPVVQQLEVRLSDLRAQRATLVATYLEDSKPVKAIDISIKQVEAEMAREKAAYKGQQRATAQNDVRRAMEQAYEFNVVRRDSLKAQLREIDAQYSAQSAKLAKLPATEAGLAEKARERDVLDVKIRQLLATLEELGNRAAAGNLVTAKVMGVRTEKDPVEPNFPRNALLGLLGGVCLGLLYCFAAESINPRIYSGSQVSQATGLTVSAALPMLRGAEGRLMKSLAGAEGEAAESFRYMASATLPQKQGEHQIVMVTGIGRGVGCSLSALNYAVAMSQAGLRVALVDADSRASLSRLFGQERASGLINVLSQESLAAAESTTVVETPHANLTLVPFGTIEGKRLTDYPVERLDAVLSALRSRADLVVIDVPPADVLAEASRLARYVDETLLVFSAKKASLSMIPAVAQLLQNAGCRQINLVMTNSTEGGEPFSVANRALLARTSS